MTLRSLLYRSARIIGDAHAVARGRYPQRIVRRRIYRATGRLGGWLSRRLGVGR